MGRRPSLRRVAHAAGERALARDGPEPPLPHENVRGWIVVRYFFRRRQPEATRILLVESGSRYLLEGLISGVRRTYGDRIFVDLLTCYAGLPKGFSPHNTTVYRVTDCKTPEDRRHLIAQLKANRYAILGIVCSAEPIMTKWKWAMAAKLPAKVFVLNENGDYFWLDWGHAKTIRHFVLFRAGLAGASATRTLARLLFFPFTLAYLLLYAGALHARRILFSRLKQ